MRFQPADSLILAAGFFSALVLTCFLTPLVLLAAQDWTWILRLAHGKQARVFVRVLEVCVLAALLLLRGRLKFTQTRDWGLAVQPAGAAVEMKAGLWLGFLSAGAAVLAAHGWGPAAWFGPDPAAITPGFVCSVLAGAAIVAAGEEVLFRAVVFGTLRRDLPGWLAGILSALVYAVAHRLGRGCAAVAFADPGAVLSYMSERLMEVAGDLPALFGLFLAGLALNLAFARTGRIYLGAGLHGMWIVAFRLHAAAGGGLDSVFPWGGPALIDGLPAWVALACAMVWLRTWKKCAP